MDVTPNPIDYSAVLEGFSSMFDTGNVVVFLFIIAMFLIYCLVLVWARRADKRDMEQHDVGNGEIKPVVLFYDVDIYIFNQDAIINQPAKVLFLSTAYAIFIRKSDEESDAEQSNEDPRKGKPVN
ncbi:hypothetical protein ACROYT_G006228 [Oculina patagonica]